MNGKEKMIESIYKAIAEGVSKLIKYGAAFTVLVACVAGLVWAMFYVVGKHESDRGEWKAEAKEIRMECDERVNLLESRIYECNEMRAQLAERVLALERSRKR